MVALILAHDKNFGIGYKNRLPWRVKQDLKHFKNFTYGKDLIVGRKTAETLPPLKGRQVYIVSRSGMSIDTALDLSKNPVVIGGAELYHYFLDNNLVDVIVATQINGTYECDVFIRQDFFVGFKETKSEDIGDGHVVKWLIRVPNNQS